MRKAWARFRGWSWWPQTLGWIGVAFIAFIALSVIFPAEEDTRGGGSDQAKQEDSKQPSVTCESLRVSEPRDDSVVHKRSLQIRGQATPNASVRFSDYDYGGLGRTRARADGFFVHTVTLSRVGHSQVVVKATAGPCPETEFGLDVTRKRTAAQLVAIRQQKAEEKARKAEENAQKEANYKATATTPDYDQLAKRPDRFKGDKVKFRGQIFQIQEDEGGGWMLLSVTDEGYGFWDDNIYVEYDRSIRSAEDDVMTVYGPITGEETYETQIGGETFVPKMTAKYIEE
jgi:hypothetical protein